MSLDTPADKCFSNIELVTNICRFLNYEQQSQLLEVCKTLRVIIIDYVWKTKYKDVEISKNSTNFIMSNEIETFSTNNCFPKLETYEVIRKSFVFLTGYEVDKFLYLNSKNIKKLAIKAESPKARHVPVTIPFQLIFKNLTYMSYCKISLDNEDFKLLAENCKLLESLILLECLNKNGGHLMLDVDIDIQIIKSMKNLKNLIIKDHCYVYGCHTLSNIQNILKNLELQQLNLHVMVASDISEDENKLDLCNLKSCKVLEIGPFEAPSLFQIFQNQFMANFENLHTFSLVRCSVTKELFNILLKSCQNLAYLSFYHCVIKDFVASPKLQEVYFDSCKLSFRHLRTILQEMSLISFTAIKNVYTGNFEYFPIATSIQKFTLIEHSNESVVESLKFNEQNLKNLKEFYWEKENVVYYDFSFPITMPNLKVLYIGHSALKIEDFLDLRYLQKIVITFVIRITISQLLKLLKQEHLRELTIFYVEECDVDIDPTAFHTKLRFLDIDCKLMEPIAGFILELLQLNEKLSLKCHDITFDFLIEILRNQKFPKRIKSINICGFPTDCNSIRDQSADAINFIRMILGKYRQFLEFNYFILE